MDFSNRYPDYAEIEGLIRRARLERSVAVADLVARAVVATGRGIRNALEQTFSAVVTYRSRHAADAGLFAPGPAHR